MKTAQASEKKSKETTKKCKVCGNTNLVTLSRYHEKVCTDHKKFVRMPWYLEEDQEYLL